MHPRELARVLGAAVLPAVVVPAAVLLASLVLPAASAGALVDEIKGTPTLGQELRPQTGSVSGQVRHEGRTPLRMKRLTNDIDVAACGRHVSPDAIIAGRKGELANVHVEILRADGSPPGGQKLEASRDPVPVTLEGCAIEPRVSVIPPGSRVELENRDAILYELIGPCVRNEPFRARLPRYRRRLVLPAKHFDHPERIVLTCERHPWIGGALIVSDNPSHALTGKDGRFVIDGLPVGAYVVRAWHPEFGSSEMEVAVNAGRDIEVEITFSDRVW